MRGKKEQKLELGLSHFARAGLLLVCLGVTCLVLCALGKFSKLKKFLAQQGNLIVLDNWMGRFIKSHFNGGLKKVLSTF